MLKIIPLNISPLITLKAETFAGRNFRESLKSRNFANLCFANFILWRKFTEKTFAILWKSSFLDGNNFRKWLGKVNNNHFKSQFNFFSSIEKWHAHTIVCPPPLSKGGGNPNFENFKKGGNLKKKFGVGETKRGGKIFKNKWGEPNFSSWL